MMPTLLVQIAFTSDLYDTTPTWTDVTSLVQSARTNRGRGGELDTFREGTCTLVLKNLDRAIEPEYSGSPYYPNVVPNKRVRISGDGTVVFDGYIDSIVPVYTIGPVGAGGAAVQVACTDMTKFMARARLESPLAAEIRGGNPVHWWRGGDAVNSQTVHDSGSGRKDGVANERAQFGATPVAAGSSVTSMTLAAIDTSVHPAPVSFPQMALTGTAWTFEMTLRAPPRLPVSTVIVAYLRGAYDPVIDSFETLLVFLSPTGPSGEEGVFLFVTDTGSQKHAFPSEVAHLAVTEAAGVRKLYINGELVGTASPTPSGVTGPLISGYLAGASHVDDFGYELTLGEVALLDVALSDADVAADAAAAIAPWEGDSTGGRIERLLGHAQIPAGFQAIADGQTDGLTRVVEPLDGQTVITKARQAELTEQGMLFVSADGIVTFLDRHHATNGTAVTTFGDSAGEIPYSDLVPNYSEDTIVNHAVVTREGGMPQPREDLASQDANGFMSAERSGVLYGTDNEAADAAQALVNRYSEAFLRFDAITIHAHRDASIAAQAVGRSIGDIVTVNRRPPGGGVAQSKTVVVEGVAHVIDPAKRSWTTTFNLSPAHTGTYWQLGRPGYSELGSTTRLAF